MEIRDDRDISDEMIRDRLYDELAARDEELATAHDAFESATDLITAKDKELAALKAVLGKVKGEIAIRKMAGSAPARWTNFDRLLANIPAPLAVVDGETIPKHIGTGVQTVLVAHLPGPSENYPVEVAVVVLPKGDER